jgi:hypothetical protein
MATQTWTEGRLPRVEWGPVIAGVLCAVAAQIVLGLFGVAFGFASRPAASSGLGVLAGVWEMVTPIVASFVGAYVAVRIAGDRGEPGALLHGAMVWCIGLIAGALFITGSLASGAMTAGAAASGNAGVDAIARHGDAGNPARAQSTASEAARGASAGTGAAGVAALLGLGGALLGAASGRRTVTGEGAGRHHGRTSEGRPTGPVGREHETGSGVVQGEAGRVTVRPPATGIGDAGMPPDEPLHH